MRDRARPRAAHRGRVHRETGERLRRSHTLARHPTHRVGRGVPRLLRGGPAVAHGGQVVHGAALGRRAARRTSRPRCSGQLGVTGRERCDVAALGGHELRDLPRRVRRRARSRACSTSRPTSAAGSQAGGPFAETLDSLKRRYPADDGTELVADDETAEAVADAHRRARPAQGAGGRRGTARGAHQGAHGRGVDARRPRLCASSGAPDARTSTTVDWKSVADGLLRQLPETERAALVGIATTVRPGFRPFRVVVEGGSE